MKSKLLALAGLSALVGACAGAYDSPDDELGGDERILHFPESDVQVALRDDGSYTITFDHLRQIERTAPSFDLRLARGTFDPRAAGAPPAIAGLDDRPAPGADVPRLYLVQFATQPIEEYRVRLGALGATSHQYLPSHAHLVRMTAEVADLVRAEPFVRWVGEYRPSWRLGAQLAAAFAARTALPTQRYWIQALTQDLGSKQDLAQRLAALGAAVHGVNSRGYLVGATLSNAQLAEITAWSDVVHVDRWSAPEIDMDLARALDGADYIEDMGGYRGQGVRAEVMDGNVVPTHPDFASRPLIFHGGRTGDASHGTPTTGIVFGDGAGNPQGRGMLPLGQGIFASYTAVTDRHAHTAELLEAPYQAMFQSNSWGDARTLEYTNISADMDQMLFDLDILILQSQSNAGNQQSRPQAWAKNILSVGGVQHLNTLVTTDDRWNFSASIGPASDGRIKPDLAHFYDSTFAPSSSGGYANFGGTSGATPITAGHAGLFYQMWDDGLFGELRPGSTMFERRPHWTTAKAMLINTASSYAFSGATHDLTRTHQGWGRPDVRRMYDLRGRFYIVDETDVLAAGGSTQHRVEVAAGTPELRATLTWADLPAVPGAAQHRVNDLTLRVVSPSGTVYFGNAGLTTGNASTPDGGPDTINTVENVWIPAPEAGVWTIEVRADELNADGHVETAAVDADYALVVSDAVAASQPPLPHPRFTQVAYDMPGNDTHEEWIEIYNPADVAIDVGGWKVRDNFRTFTIPAGTMIGPNGYLDIARDGAAYTALTGRNPDLAGSNLSLGNTGDHLTLVDPGGTSIDFVAWEQGFPGWETLATKRGRAIVRRDPNADTDARADWTVRDPAPRGGSEP